MADKANTKKTTKKAKPKAPAKAKADKPKMLVVETRVKAQIKEKCE